jgi:hypothetical protein
VRKSCAAGCYSLPFPFPACSTADGLDYLLLVLGVVGGLGSGVFLPLFAIVFGDFANACKQQRC